MTEISASRRHEVVGGGQAGLAIATSWIGRGVTSPSGRAHAHLATQRAMEDEAADVAILGLCRSFAEHMPLSAAMPFLPACGSPTSGRALGEAALANLGRRGAFQGVR